MANLNKKCVSEYSHSKEKIIAFLGAERILCIYFVTWLKCLRHRFLLHLKMTVLTQRMTRASTFFVSGLNDILDRGVMLGKWKKYA